MSQPRCLYCYQPLGNNEIDFHPGCSKKIFDQTEPPILPYNEADLEDLALQVIQSQSAVTGVQPKISLDISKSDSSAAKKLTIVGLWGAYILKPPTNNYPFLPEVEDLTMNLAAIAKIKTVPHSLIRLQAGELAYITRRIDRVGKKKIHMEDMCQLTERLTEDKYHGSYEQIAKAIKKYSAHPGLDIVNFFELVVFSFLTGNTDMHLKNFSLIQQEGVGMVVSPAYDLVATKLVNPTDDEDFALTLNAKKKRIKKQDFTTAFKTAGIDARQQENIFKKMQRAKADWKEMVQISFLTEDYKKQFVALIEERFDRIY